MKILGIESTCDETSCSIVEDGEHILGHVILSQADLHARFGGVFPEYASREHIENMLPCIEATLSEAGCSLETIDAIGVAHTPGLMGALLMGVTCAQTLSYSLDVPLIPVNHIEAHLYAAMMGQEKLFPALGVVLSGGHTFIVEITGVGAYTLLSTTVDDAIGESFDKVASLLGLPYPGGPHVERLAKTGDPVKYPFSAGRVKGRPLHFSFSGLKTNVRYTVEKLGEHFDTEKPHVAASFQHTACTDVCQKIAATLTRHPARALYAGGGVTMNQTLKKYLANTFPDLPLFFPKKNLSLDNAAMIAGLAYHKKSTPLDAISALPRSMGTFGTEKPL